MIRFLCILCFCTISTECFIIHTTMGFIRGKLVVDSYTNTSYISYLGIPYAEAPEKNLRFQPPVPKSPWRTIFDATKPGYVCPQAPGFHSREEMSEDCLNFNVHAPIDSLGKSLPVLLTIHGGGFNSQSGRPEPIYGPPFLIKENIIVVTLNYRLGIPGFLSLNSEKLPGNAGLKDVILAIKVIRENINKFGGDVNRITIRGTGAGAAIVSYLMVIDPKCNEKFQNVMIHSGNFLSPNYIQTNLRENAKLLATALNVNSTNDDDFIRAAVTADVDHLIEIETGLTNDNTRTGFRDSRLFKPVVEPPHATAVLTKNPAQLMEEGSICDVPVFTGFNNKEGYVMEPLIRAQPNIIKKLNNNFDAFIPEDLQYLSGDVRKKLAAEIKQFYLNGKNISMNNIQGYYDMMTDTQFAYSTNRFVKMLKAKIKSPVYYYLWAGDNELNWFKGLHNITLPGTAHCDNLGYTFLTSVTKPIYATLDFKSKQAHANIMKNMHHFLTYGKPPTYSSEWPDTAFEGYHVVMNNVGVFTIYQASIPDRISFWESVYKEYQLFKNDQPTPTNQPIPTDQPTQKKKLITAVLEPVEKIVNKTFSAVTRLVGGILGR